MAVTVGGSTRCLLICALIAALAMAPQALSDRLREESDVSLDDPLPWDAEGDATVLMDTEMTRPHHHRRRHEAGHYTSNGHHHRHHRHPSHRHHRHHRFKRFPALEGGANTAPPTSGGNNVATSTTAPVTQTTTQTQPAAAGQAQPTTGSRFGNLAKQTMHKARQKMQTLSQQAKQTMHQATQQAGQALHQATQQAGQTLHQATQNVRAQATRGMQTLKKKMNSTMHHGVHAVKKAVQQGANQGAQQASQAMTTPASSVDPNAIVESASNAVNSEGNEVANQLPGSGGINALPQDASVSNALTPPDATADGGQLTSQATDPATSQVPDQATTQVSAPALTQPVQATQPIEAPNQVNDQAVQPAVSTATVGTTQPPSDAVVSDGTQPIDAAAQVPPSQHTNQAQQPPLA